MDKNGLRCHPRFVLTGYHETGCCARVAKTAERKDNFEHLAVPTRRLELSLKISCRNPIFRVDFAKRVIGNFREEGFDNIVKYLKIPGIKNDPGRIAMTKKYRHMGVK
tara:strand:- start:357 stop:680 length:324 start_codon:yes stop_codon:yes gene_type:complete